MVISKLRQAHFCGLKPRGINIQNDHRSSGAKHAFGHGETDSARASRDYRHAVLPTNSIHLDEVSSSS